MTRRSTARRSSAPAAPRTCASGSPPRWTPRSRQPSRPTPEDAWTSIKYPTAIFDAQASGWVSDAQVAEIGYTAFASTKNPVTARLIVRRVKHLNTQADQGHGEPFPLYRYHPVFTDSPFTLLQAEDQHRDHAIIEQVNADLTDRPPTHPPSGDFNANAAWLTRAAITHNLLRATGTPASAFHARAHGTTLRRHPISIPARLARHGHAGRAGHITMHPPDHRRRQTERWVREGRRAAASR